jgi:hypothetical protein
MCHEKTIHYNYLSGSNFFMLDYQRSTAIECGTPQSEKSHGTVARKECC